MKISYYAYIINWISFIIQNQGLNKTKVALILNGPQGCGKNAAFSDVLSELLADYWNNNVTDIE
jgi:Cdc6-like AAA superfamily ATPase